MTLVDIDPLNVLIGFVIGVFTTIVAEIIRYRHQRKILVTERLTPLLERMLGSVVRLIKYGEEAKGLESATRQLLASQENNEPDLVTTVKASLYKYSLNSLLSMVGESKEFESIYARLAKSGMLETIRTNDEYLFSKLGWLHGCTKTFSEEKIGSTEEAITLSHTLVQNTVLFAKDCEKPLRKFVKV